MGIVIFPDPSTQFGIKYMTPTCYAGFLPHPYKELAYPNMYLDFCLKDIQQKDLRGRTNAFNNCKKAIHLRIDLILNQYGLLIPNMKCDFPTKLEIIESVGLLPTLLLKNINDERNLIEHSYVLPDEKRVEEVIDVAELLYLATDRLMKKTPIEVIVGFDTEPLHRLMRMEPTKGEINFYKIETLKKELMYYNEKYNVYHMKGILRDFNGDLSPFYKVSDEIYDCIDLNNNNKDNWMHIIKNLYYIINGDDRFNEGIAYVHIPLDVKESISEFLKHGPGKK